MQRNRLEALLEKLTRSRVLVIGDYFLDKYLDIDRSLAETSLETGLEAHQVFRVRCSPGAAGTVVSNLCSLGIQVISLGIIGDDGEGYELLRGLAERGADTQPLIQTPVRMTPTYTKPMMHEVNGQVHELSRLDVKTRVPLSSGMEDEIIERLAALFDHVDGIIVADQMPERNRGVMTDRVRETLCALAADHPEVVVAVDSRQRIGEYRNVILKPNRHEALRATWPQKDTEAPSIEIVQKAGRALMERSGKPVFVTAGAKGIWLFETGKGAQRIPAVPVQGEIDIVGAGDSTMAGIVGGLCCGASSPEAALIGNLVASVTIQCIGTTGTAKPQQVLEALNRWQQASQRPSQGPERSAADCP